MASTYYSYQAPPLKHYQMSLERIDKFISEIYFTDVNLQSRLLAKHVAPTTLSHFKADGRFDFKLAQCAEYEPVEVGYNFGPIWSSHWFKVNFQVPKDFVSGLSEDEEVLFYWDTCTEATIWDENTSAPIGAFSCAEPHGNVRDYIPVTNQLKSSTRPTSDV
ncbi:MAN2C1 [Bugula neritina]|uniref:MAN2C1 n=1 Tax=Bugula neritina TaxID=10212 RepID=A0A7J7JEB2_BUGNE|nr:MAN2C1 [Bugula neritina]